MNFFDFSFDEGTRQTLTRLQSTGRIPHALLIESRSAEKAEELARYLAMMTVCESEEKPCGVCRSCVSAKARCHADVFYPEPTNKSKTYAIDQIREVIRDAYIKPNGSGGKAFIFEHSDERFKEDSQNAFLKVLEEPPQGVRFMLLCESANSLLPTIRSRCTVLRTGGEALPDDEARAAAEAIARGIAAPSEYELLRAVSALGDKERADGILSALRLIFRDATALLSGADTVFSADCARALASRLTKRQVLALFEPTDTAARYLKQNVNINLLTTWLCGEYRRISWQK